MTPTTSVLTTSSRAVSSQLIHGVVIERHSHPRGSVLVLPPGQIAVYCLRAVKCRSFVFRTLGRPEPLATEIPGVSPCVRLLMQMHTLGRLARLEELLRYLAKTRQQPSSLSDTFYLRLHAILSGKLPSSGKVLRSLLDQENSAIQVA
jgi:hypothetical protein